MSTARKIALLLLALVAAGAAVLALFLSRGFSAREQPGRLEAFLARRLRHLATPREGRNARNPLPPTAEVLADGRAHFADHCAICHANDGSGQTEIGQGLYPKAPDMRLPQTQELSDGEIFYIIRNGVRFTGMPAWGGNSAEEDKDTWELVHFIRHLPQITPEELEEMKALNPKSPQELAEEDEMRRFLEGKDASPPAHRHQH